MTVFNKVFQDINEYDLLQLIENKYPEGKEIDYKLILPSNSDSDKKELLYDVTSFANTSGGYLVFGLNEASGFPTEIAPLQAIDPDAEIRRLESTILSAIQPRIQGLSLRSIQSGNGHVIVIHIPKSWIGPHMVTYQNMNRFYARNSAGKYMLDVQQLRASFAESEQIHEKIRRFRFDRINNIQTQETPIPLENGPKLILHLIPQNFMETSVDVNNPIIRESSPAPISNSGWNERVNFDGLLTFFQPSSRPLSASYVQLFRNGSMEAVDSFLIQQGEAIPLNGIESRLMKGLNSYLKLFNRLEVALPLVLMLSVLNIKDFSTYGGEYTSDRANLILEPFLIESYDINIQQFMQPIFNILWNTFGCEKSHSYDQEGRWNRT